MARILLAGLVAVLIAASAPAPAFAIAGGRPADPAATPWFVTFDSCGGTLVAPDRVLTAAHCVADDVPADLGPVDVAGAPGQSPLVSAISVHPRFDLDAFSRLEDWTDHDVAVLQLDREVEGVTPVRLGSARAGQALQVVGRGATGGGAAPGVRGRPLLAATLRAQSDAACARFWRTYRDGEDRDSFAARLMLCGSDPRPGARRRRDTCTGDSGGPAFVRDRAGAVRQVGVTSWGAGRCGGAAPSVFAEVAAERAFIERRRQPWAPVPAGRPVLAGTAAIGATLTCTPPAWTIAPDRASVVFFSFRFREGERTVQRGTSTTYAVRPADRGATIGCRVEASTAGGRVRHHAPEHVRVPPMP
jgi:hypothetical protein